MPIAPVVPFSKPLKEPTVIDPTPVCPDTVRRDDEAEVTSILDPSNPVVAVTLVPEASANAKVLIVELADLNSEDDATPKGLTVKYV